jgi:hypothetical protein
VDYMSSKRLTLKEVLFLTTSVWILMGSAAFGAPTAQLDKATFRDSPPTGAVKDASEVKTAKDAEESSVDGFKVKEEDKEDKDKKKEGEEEAVKGTTVNGQQLYKQTVDGKEYQYYYSTGEKGSQFISQMQPDGSFKQTTTDAMLGRGGENGMRPIGSIETTNGKLATMYTMDGVPGSKAFFDGESWHIQGQGADSFTVTKGPNIPGEYAEYTAGFDSAKAPLESLPEGWSRGASSGGEVLRGGSPVGDVGVAQNGIVGEMGGAHGQLVDALNSAPYTNWGEDFDPQLMSKISSLSDAQAQEIYSRAVANAAKSRAPCVGCEVGFLLERVK